MSWQYNSQKKPNNKICNLLQERIEKANLRRTIIAEEENQLSRLESIAAKLKRWENVHNLQLQIWFNENEYAKIDVALQKQLRLNRVLMDKQADFFGQENTYSKGWNLTLRYSLSSLPQED